MASPYDALLQEPADTGQGSPYDALLDGGSRTPASSRYDALLGDQQKPLTIQERQAIARAPVYEPQVIAPETSAAANQDWMTGAAQLPPPQDKDISDVNFFDPRVQAARWEEDLQRTWKWGQEQLGEAARLGWSYHPGVLAARKLLPPESPVRQMGEAIPEFAKGLTTGLATPENAAIAAAFELGAPAFPLLAKLGSTGFSAWMASELPEVWHAFKEAPDVKTKTEIALQGVAQLAFAAGAGIHGVSGLAEFPRIRVPRVEAPPPEVEALPIQAPERMLSGVEPRLGLPEPIPSLTAAELPPSARVEGPAPPVVTRPEPEPVRVTGPSAAPEFGQVQDWFSERMAEGRQLGEQERLAREAGLPIPKSLQDQIDANNAAIRRGFPLPEERRFVAELPGEPLEEAAPERRFTAEVEQQPLSAEELRRQAAGLRTIEQPLGGEEGAVKQGYAQMETPRAALGVEKGSPGAVAPAGDRYNAVREAERAETGRGLPQGALSQALEPVESQWVKLTPEEFQRAIGGERRFAAEPGQPGQPVTDWRRSAFDMIQQAVNNDRPVNARLMDEVARRPPADYVRRGDVYEPPDWNENRQAVAPWGERLKNKINAQPPQGFVPNLWPEVFEFGRHVYQRGMDYARWGREMLGHLGERIRRHLGNIWDGLRDLRGGRTLPQARERGAIGYTGLVRARETRQRSPENIARQSVQRVIDNPVSLRTQASLLRRILPRELRSNNPVTQINNAIGFFRRSLVRAARSALKEPWARAASKQYQGYNIYSHRLADEFGYQPERVMAGESALSPNTSPEQSHEAARRLMKMMRDNAGDRFDQKMMDWARSATSTITNEKLYLPAELRFLKGKSFSELPRNSMMQAKWMRAFDEVYHPDKALRTIRPDGTLGNREKTSFAWTTFKLMQNGIDALRGSRPLEEILSTPKVSNYYMSKLLAFEPSNHVVVDTHHTSLAFGNSLPAGHELVKRVFGAVRAGSNNEFGGFYSILHEATIQAAREVGMDPKEFQALVWAYQRGYKSPLAFGRSTLGKAAVESIQQLWKDAASGRLTEHEAHERTEKIARDYHGRIPAPAYFEERPSDRALKAAGDAGKPAELSQGGGYVRVAERGGRGDAAAGVATEPAAAGVATIREAEVSGRGVPKRGFRVDTFAGRSAFETGIQRTAQEHKYGAAVEVKSPEFYRDPNTRLFLSRDGLAGAAVTPDGDLVSVFKHPQSKADMRAILAEASEHANRLDAFTSGNGYLPTLYAQHGFRPVARVPFDPRFAPPGWNYQLSGMPDIVLMVKDRANVLNLPDPRIRGYPAIQRMVPVERDFAKAQTRQAEAVNRIAAREAGQTELIRQEAQGVQQTRMKLRANRGISGAVGMTGMKGGPPEPRPGRRLEFLAQPREPLEFKEAEPAAEEPIRQTPPANAPVSTGISNARLEEIYGKDAVAAGRGRSAKAWKDIGAADRRDPYAVLSEAQRNGIAPPADVALLRAEHKRLLDQARAAWDTPRYDALAQRANDFGNAVKGVAHGPASDVMRALQEDDKPTYTSPADFDRIVRERLNRESSPAERKTFEKATGEVRKATVETREAAAEGRRQLRRTLPRSRKPVSFEDASDYVRNHIADLLKDCV
jgi:hypothetical protein